MVKEKMYIYIYTVPCDPLRKSFKFHAVHSVSVALIVYIASLFLYALDVLDRFALSSVFYDFLRYRAWILLSVAFSEGQGLG